MLLQLPKNVILIPCIISNQNIKYQNIILLFKFIYKFPNGYISFYSIWTFELKNHVIILNKAPYGVPRGVVQL